LIEKALLAVIGLAAIWALTLLCVCAAGFALFAGLAAPLGPAWAAALVALVAGLLLAIVVLASRSKPAAHAPPMEEESLSARAFDLARRYPVAAGAASVLALVAAGTVVVKNPKVIATAISAFLAGRSAGHR